MDSWMLIENNANAQNLTDPYEVEKMKIFWGYIFISLLLFNLNALASGNGETPSHGYFRLNNIVHRAPLYEGKTVRVEGVYFDGFEATPLLVQDIIDHKNGYFFLMEPKLRVSWRINQPNKALDQYATRIPGPGGGVRYARVLVTGVFKKGGGEELWNEYPHEIQICDIMILDPKTGKYRKQGQVFSKKCP